MRPVFQEFDRSHRGCTAPRVQAGRAAPRAQALAARVEQVLQHLDADGNGEISYIELETFVDEQARTRIQEEPKRGTSPRECHAANGGLRSAAAGRAKLEEALARQARRRRGGALRTGSCDAAAAAQRQQQAV